MAERLGVPLSTTALAIELAELPLQLFASMEDPRGITASQARKLIDASRKDPAGLSQRIASVATAKRASAREVLAQVLA